MRKPAVWIAAIVAVLSSMLTTGVWMTIPPRISCLNSAPSHPHLLRGKGGQQDNRLTGGCRRIRRNLPNQLACDKRWLRYRRVCWPERAHGDRGRHRD